MSNAATFLEEVQRTITPIVPGDSFSLLMIPLRSSRFTRPLFRTPDEELGIGFDTLRALPHGTNVEQVLALQSAALRPLSRARWLAVPDQRRASRRR
jgi:hypothetical protein